MLQIEIQSCYTRIMTETCPQNLALYTVSSKSDTPLRISRPSHCIDYSPFNMKPTKQFLETYGEKVELSNFY